MPSIDAAVAFFGALSCALLGAFVLWEEPRSVVHRAFALGMLALGATDLCVGFGVEAVLPSDVLFWQRLGLVPRALLPGLWLVFSLTFARSNHRDLIDAWRWVIHAAFLIPLAIVALAWDSIYSLPARLPESAPLEHLRLGWPGQLYTLFWLVAAIAILAILEGTLRASTGGKRWQIKFMILGVGSFFTVELYRTSQAALFNSVPLVMEPVVAYAILAAGALIVVSLVRDRMLAAEVYLSRAFLENSITVIVAGAYLITVGVLAQAIHYLGGNDYVPVVALFVFLALLSLTIFLLSDQMRQRVRRFISANFTRPSYDYRKKWTAFTERTARLVELKRLGSEVSRMVSETFGAGSVTIWLLDEAHERCLLGGSTELSEGKLPRAKELERGAFATCSWMRERTGPVDLAPAHELRRAHEDFFSIGRVRYCAPLAAGRELLGIMTLSERVGKQPFSTEDLDLLKTIADQAAGSLLNLQLSERLLKAKELEAFQTVSTFFVHDLKNLASMLSLTMQNLPSNFDKPEFRKDALRVISESVAKIDRMCGRLSSISLAPELRMVETDLNRLVEDAVGGLDGSISAGVERELRPVPKVAADPEQMEKVLVNMVLNAADALNGSGQIRVSTERKGDWAVVTISDDGCGMSEEYIQRSLFRPFQTTKSKGLGVGLFQSKQIVEAHHGRIEVESEPGKGSSFRVMLPCR